MSSTELSRARWRKSSYSNGQANCVEVAAVTGRRSVVTVRDNKAPDGPSLIFTVRAWRQFIDGVQATQKACRLQTTSYQRNDVPARQVNRLLRYST